MWSEQSGVRQTMASPENLGSLYFSAAAWALEMVGLEMMIGLALSEVRAQASEWQDLPGTLSAIVKGSRPCLLVRGWRPLRHTSRSSRGPRDARDRCARRRSRLHVQRMDIARVSHAHRMASHVHHMCIA